MKRYALIGRRLGHSWSQRWFEGLFERQGLHDCTYELREMEQLNEVRQWVENKAIAGFNVTVPYKQEIIPHLDALDPIAEAIGAVNCVSVEQGHLVGYNTDAPAFLDTLKDARFEFHHCLILGTGGAAQAVAFAVRRMGVEPLFISRNPQGDRQIGYNSLLSLHLHPQTLIVNATPVGMYPSVEDKPLELSTLNGKAGMVYDLIYNPSPTALLKEAERLGLRTHDGLEMLKKQAEMSWKIWNRNT